MELHDATDWTLGSGAFCIPNWPDKRWYREILENGLEWIPLGRPELINIDGRSIGKPNYDMYIVLVMTPVTGGGFVEERPDEVTVAAEDEEKATIEPMAEDYLTEIEDLREQLMECKSENEWLRRASQRRREKRKVPDDCVDDDDHRSSINRGKRARAMMSLLLGGEEFELEEIDY